MPYASAHRGSSVTGIPIQAHNSLERQEMVSDNRTRSCDAAVIFFIVL